MKEKKIINLNEKISGKKQVKKLTMKEQNKQKIDELSMNVLGLLRQNQEIIAWIQDLEENKLQGLRHVGFEMLIHNKILEKIVKEHVGSNYEEIYKEMQEKVMEEQEKLGKEMLEKKREECKEKGICPNCLGQGRVANPEFKEGEDVSILCGECKGNGKYEKE